MLRDFMTDREGATSTPSPHRTSRVTPLGGDELGIGPIGSDQVSVAPAGHHLPLVDHDYAVGREDGRQPVRDDQGGAARHQAGHGGLDQPLVLAIQIAGGLVQHENAQSDVGLGLSPQ